MRSLIVSSLFILPSLGQAQNLCSQFLLNNGVYLSSEKYSLSQQNNPAAAKALTLDLLKMTAFTRDAVFNQKEVVEKGSLVLGQPLKDGYSLEFEYVADNRGAAPVFKLKQTSLVKPNGDRGALDKSALTLDNANFNKDQFNAETLGFDPGVVKIEAPLVIAGDVYKNISYWASRSEFLKHPELQGIESSKDGRSLYRKALTRSTVDYARNVAKKQTFKFALLGLALYLYNNQERLVSRLSLTDPWEGMTKDTREIIRSSEVQTLLQNESKTHLKVPLTLPKATSQKEVEFTKLEKILPKLESLSLLEEHAKSKVELYIALNNGTFQKFIDFTGLNQYLEVGNPQFVLHFPEQSRLVWLVADSEVSELSGARFAVIALDSKKSELAPLYQSFLRSLQSK